MNVTVTKSFSSLKDLLCDVNPVESCFSGGMALDVSRSLHTSDHGALSFADSGGDKFWMMFSRRFMEGDDLLELTIYRSVNGLLGGPGITISEVQADLGNLHNHFWLRTSDLFEALKSA